MISITKYDIQIIDYFIHFATIAGTIRLIYLTIFYY